MPDGALFFYDIDFPEKMEQQLDMATRELASIKRTTDMVGGRLGWTKSKCLKCCGCINCCPVSAIQYGRRAVKRGRCVNPVLK